MKSNDTEKETKAHGRAKGSGWLVKRGKYWVACWKRDGKLYKRTTKTDVKKDAWEKLSEFTQIYQLKDERTRFAALAEKAKAASDKIQEQIDALPALKLSGVWTVYEPIATKKYKSNWVYVIEGQYARFCRWLAGAYSEITEPRQVTRKIAQQYYDFLVDKSSPTSADKYISQLKNIWLALMERDVIEEEEHGEEFSQRLDFVASRIGSNPWNGVVCSKLPKVRFSRRELTVDELNRIYQHTEGEYRVLFALGIYTGLRLGDCALLEWDNVDLARGFISRVPIKTESTSGAVVREAIAEPLYNILSAIPNEKRVGYVVPEIAELYRTSRAGASRVIRNTQKIFVDCGIKTTVGGEDGHRKKVLVGFHSLRHTYVSLIMNRGGNMDVVRKTVGHTSAMMTGHYWHADEKTLKETAALLPDVSSGSVKIETGGGSREVDKILSRLETLGEEDLEEIQNYITQRKCSLGSSAKVATAHA